MAAIAGLILGATSRLVIHRSDDSARALPIQFPARRLPKSAGPGECGRPADDASRQASQPGCRREQNASVSLLPYERVAIAWALGNIALAGAVWPTRPVPWLLVALTGLAPLTLFFFADYIAARMYRGMMERLASDYRTEQSPLVIKLLGWVALILTTAFLLFY